MTFQPVVTESARPDNRAFYVPAYELRIEGAGLPHNVLRDISEFTYRDSLTEIDQFELVVNNWDPAQRRCKYIGSETAADLTAGGLAKLFEPCGKTVTVKMGYADRLLVMMAGNFTTMEPNFPSSGAPVLSVRGLNVLHQLRRKRFSTAWENRSPSWIARNIGTLTDAGKPRFPVPIEIDAAALSAEAAIPYIAQTNQTDVDFLLNLARQHGYEFTVVEWQADTRRPARLKFGPGITARLPVNYRLDWGRTLVDFKPTLTTAGQFKSLTVSGWDRRAQRPIEVKVGFDDPELRRMNANLQRIIVDCDPREEKRVDLPVFSRADARRRALAMLHDVNASMVTATGTTVGLPELKSGTKIEIAGVGSRLSGEYLVTKTIHSIGDQGYTTRFECRREDFTGARA
jgi:phage protein D